MRYRSHYTDRTTAAREYVSHDERQQFHRLGGLMSVVTPVNNERHYLRRAVESVASQSVPVLEHIIVNDGSTDGVETLLTELSRRYPHLVVVSQKRKGAASARNHGIRIARGRYIAFLDADDEWAARKVERQVAFMSQHDVAFSYGDYVEVHHESRELLRRYKLPDRLGHRQLLRGCPIGCLTAAYDQEKLGKHYFPITQSGHDWGLWLDIARHGAQIAKYPGTEARYSNGRPSLSSRKLIKIVRIYRLYRRTEQLGRFHAIFRTLQHTLLAVAKKARIIYTPD